MSETTKPFVVFRISPDGRLTEVFRAEDIKKAKYWLNYIAETGDVLCKTCAHPKHTGQSKAAEYYCHKDKSGKSTTDHDVWKEMATQRGAQTEFPEA